MILNIKDYQFWSLAGDKAFALSSALVAGLTRVIALKEPFENQTVNAVVSPVAVNDYAGFSPVPEAGLINLLEEFLPHYFEAGITFENAVFIYCFDSSNNHIDKPLIDIVFDQAMQDVEFLDLVESDWLKSLSSLTNSAFSGGRRVFLFGASSCYTSAKHIPESRLRSVHNSDGVVCGEFIGALELSQEQGIAEVKLETCDSTDASALQFDESQEEKVILFDDLPLDSEGAVERHTLLSGATPNVISHHYATQETFGFLGDANLVAHVILSTDITKLQFHRAEKVMSYFTLPKDQKLLVTVS